MPDQPLFYEDHVGTREQYDGRSPLSWRVSTYAVAVRDDALLMVEPAWAKRWELPGGGVELETQETLADAARRECWEETGFRFTPTEAPHFVREMYFLLRDADSFCHSLIFAVRGTVGDQPDSEWRQDPKEIKSVCWVPLTSLQHETIHAPHRDALRVMHLL
jgi:8-oxo-dGTP pyrophosphatase MutT (NUDIX family)